MQSNSNKRSGVKSKMKGAVLHRTRTFDFVDRFLLVPTATFT